MIRRQLGPFNYELYLKKGKHTVVHVDKLKPYLGLKKPPGFFGALSEVKATEASLPQLVACNYDNCSHMGTAKQVTSHHLWKHCSVNTVPYACKICGYRAQTKRGIRIHRRVRHHGRGRKEDLKLECYGTYETLSNLYAVSYTHLTLPTKRIV